MRIDFTARQTEISAELRRLAERKLEKLGRLLPGVTRAHVTLAADRHRQLAEVSVHSRQLDLSAEETSSNARRSLAGAIDKLLRQADKQRTRRRPRKGAESPRLAPAAARGPAMEAGGEGGSPRVIRSRRTAV
ncbi:MAG: ribosome hibernation-promoting factor, HPF/YfiA family, partial [Betaproteobacteria bacterium]